MNTCKHTGPALTQSSVSIDIRYWIVALLITVVLHLLVLGLFIDSATALEGDAQQQGEQGIEIGLGQQGSYSDIKERLSKLNPENIEIIKKEKKETIKKQPIKKSELSTKSVKPRNKNEREETEAKPNASPAPVMAAAKATGKADENKSGGLTGNAMSYINDINRWLLKHQNYPASAKKEKQEGIVRLAFTIDRNGHVLKRSIAGSSGFSTLDQAALNMIDDASPLPNVPSDFFPSKKTLSLVKPIDFKLITNTSFRD
jgi:protein TonB